MPLLVWWLLVVVGTGVLVDSTGRVLRDYPATPSLIGRNLSGRYGYLRAALLSSGAGTG